MDSADDIVFRSVEDAYKETQRLNDEALEEHYPMTQEQKEAQAKKEQEAERKAKEAADIREELRERKQEEEKEEQLKKEKEEKAKAEEGDKKKSDAKTASKASKKEEIPSPHHSQVRKVSSEAPAKEHEKDNQLDKFMDEQINN